MSTKSHLFYILEDTFWQKQNKQQQQNKNKTEKNQNQLCQTTEAFVISTQSKDEKQFLTFSKQEINFFMVTQLTFVGRFVD